MTRVRDPRARAGPAAGRVAPGPPVAVVMVRGHVAVPALDSARDSRVSGPAGPGLQLEAISDRTGRVPRGACMPTGPETAAGRRLGAMTVTRPVCRQRQASAGRRGRQRPLRDSRPMTAAAAGHVRNTLRPLLLLARLVGGSGPVCATVARCTGPGSLIKGHARHGGPVRDRSSGDRSSGG